MDGIENTRRQNGQDVVTPCSGVSSWVEGALLAERGGARSRFPPDTLGGFGVPISHPGAMAKSYWIHKLTLGGVRTDLGWSFKSH